ncbi:MAG TPA: RICIN domain-containing protein [Thermoanaerobaculia bacterium]|nr:RICIN domain-containing protein [Thermoanaerobaculia bacterium]
MRPRRPCSLPFTFLAFLFLVCAGAARAGEIVDGNNPPTVRNNMHSCPPGYILTGVHVNNNQLLCTGQFENGQSNLTVNEIVDSGGANAWPPDAETRAAHNYTGSAMHWCGPNRFMTGVHVANNAFNCSEFASGSSRNYTNRLGHLVVDTSTVRNGMHACPRGTVLVGAHFGNNAFLCAELPFCEDTSHCPGSSDVCEFSSVNCPGCIGPVTGVCRRQGQLSFREDNGCFADFVGSLTDRSQNVANFTSQPGFTNDEARSLSLSNVRAGTIIRVYDDSTGATSDDWTQIFAKSTVTACVGTFQSSFEDASLRVEHHRVDNLDGKVSRVDVRSAMIDFAGRCLDVNMNNNAAQIFDCHAGPNQSWIYEVDGEIRGVNNLCLEANSSEIHTWPNLTAGQVRRAAVRVANCTGSVHQKWTVTEAGQIRMFADMCLDIVGGTSQNNAAVQIYPCHGGQNQRWVSSF